MTSKGPFQLQAFYDFVILMILVTQRHNNSNNNSNNITLVTTGIPPFVSNSMKQVPPSVISGVLQLLTLLSCQRHHKSGTYTLKAVKTSFTPRGP